MGRDLGRTGLPLSRPELRGQEAQDWLEARGRLIVSAEPADGGTGRLENIEEIRWRAESGPVIAGSQSGDPRHHPDGEVGCTRLVFGPSRWFWHADGFKAFDPRGQRFCVIDWAGDKVFKLQRLGKSGMSIPLAIPFTPYRCRLLARTNDHRQVAE